LITRWIRRGTSRPPHDQRRGATFAALRIRNYRLFFVGQGISVAGNWMQNIAVGWQVLALTHSGVMLGVATAARFAPLILLGPWGGVVTDRSNKRRLMTVTQVGQAALSFALAAASISGHASLGVLLATVTALGIVNVFDAPVRQSIVSSLVDEAHLGNAIALNSIVMSASRVLGPALAGALITGFGVTPCFFANAISFVVVIVSILMMRESEIMPSVADSRAKGQIRAGLRYCRSRPDLLGPLIMVAVTGTFTWEFPVSLPLITTGTFHGQASAYGTAMAFLGVGAVGGGFIAARRHTHSLRALAVSAILWGSLILAASMAPNFPVELALLVLVGSASTTFNAMAKTVLQLRSAPNMRGRVMSLWFMAWQGSTIVGAPLVGAIGGSIGPRFALGIGGLASLIVGLVYGRVSWSQFWRIRKRNQHDLEAEVPAGCRAAGAQRQLG
jgi:MFS family permease